VALKGGLLKKEQMLSGTMADIFSNLYLALSVQHYHNNYNASLRLTEYITKKLMNENQRLINTVVDNLGPERIFLMHLKKSIKNDDFNEERAIFDEIIKNPNIMEEIKKNIHVENNILKDLETANRIEKGTDEHKELVSRIINVDEFEA
jgi:hypothetical protein